MKKLVIFDLDGTLLDTAKDLSIAVNFALKIKKFPCKSQIFIKKTLGNGVRNLIRRCIPKSASEEDYLETLRIFREYYLEHLDIYTKPYHYVKKCIKQLKSEGFKLAVASNKMDSASKYLVEKFFPGYFDIVVGDNKTLDRKPSPDMVNFICSNLQIDKKDVLYIGDSDVDEKTALNSKVEYLLLTSGYRSEKVLNELCPQAKKIPSLKNLIIS